MSRSQSGKKFGEGRHNLKFLQEIEAISKTLYLDKMHQKTSNPSLPELKPNLKDGYSPPKEKRSIWTWKALKALSHIRNKRFRCCFTFQVHSIQRLPSNLNDLSLYVNLKRHDTVLMTCPVRVCNGNAEFEEQLTYACSVYGSKSGSHNLVKYEAKDFSIYASIVCYDELDLGMHRIDLTRLLPLTFEELEEENCSGKWSTSFRLSGKAQGGIMNVSFGYSMVENHSNMSEVGVKSRLDEDLKHYPELFDSIKMLYLKLEEEENSKASADYKVEAEFSTNSCSSNNAKDIVESNVKDNELSTVDQMKSLPLKEEVKLEEDNKAFLDENPELCDSIIKLFLKLEEENSKTPVDEKVEVDFKTNLCSLSSVKENVESEWEVNELSTVGQMMDIRSMEEAKLEDYEYILDENLFTERNLEEGYLSNKESVNSNHVDVDESITNGFISMLENEPESPRERLLKEFEKDTSANWDSFFNFDFNQENTRFGSDDSSSTGNMFEGSPSKYSNSNLNRTEGLRSYVRTKTGGIVKHINPQLYNDRKIKGSLIIQVSSPIVLSAEVGEGIMDILQRLTLIGNGKKSVQARKLMPMEDIDEKMIQEIAWESLPNLEEYARSEFVTIEDLVPLAMEKIGSLSIERFQIQSSVSNKDASSNITRGLIGLSLTLDEWMRLESGEIDGADEISNPNSKHEKAGGKNGNSRKYGLRGNKIIIALMVQIHDQLKNYKPICAPMLGFIQAEIEEQSNEDEFVPKFRIIDVHVADIEAEIPKKKILDSKNNIQCRSRWSVANGMKKSNKHPLLKAKILERGVK